MAPPVPPEYDEPVRARIPADLDTEDQILAGLTARQLLTLGVILVPVLAAWRALAGHVPAPTLLAATGPVVAGAVLLALTRRDGLSLDRWLLAAVQHRTGARRLHLSIDLTPAATNIDPAARIDSAGPGRTTGGIVEKGRDTWPAAPRAEPGDDERTAPGRAGHARAVRKRRRGRPAASPLTAVTEGGVLVHADGRHVAVIACTTIATALATHQDDAILAAGMARWLNSLSAPVQIVVQNRPTDLASMATAVVARSQVTSQPDLAVIALDHASMLLDLAETMRPLQRTVFIACSGGTSTSSEHLQRLVTGIGRRLGGPLPRTRSRSLQPESHESHESRRRGTTVRVSARASAQALSHAHRTAAGLEALGARTLVLDGPQVRQVLAGAWTPCLLPSNPQHGARQFALAGGLGPAGLPLEARAQDRDGWDGWDGWEDGADWAGERNWPGEDAGPGQEHETGRDERDAGLQDWSHEAREWFTRSNELPGRWDADPADEPAGGLDGPSVRDRDARIVGNENAVDDNLLDHQIGSRGEVLPTWKGIRAQRFFDPVRPVRPVRLNERTTPRRPQ